MSKKKTLTNKIKLIFFFQILNFEILFMFDYASKLASIFRWVSVGLSVWISRKTRVYQRIFRKRFTKHIWDLWLFNIYL